MNNIEQIILRYPRRGMDVLSSVLSPDFCREAAETIYALERGTVLLLTGFCVRGYAETDGPAGTWAIANALSALGFTPVIVADRFLHGVFESSGFQVEYVPVNGTDTDAEALLEKYRPVLLLSLERCGRTEENDYINMRGMSIRSCTAPVDALFLRAYGSIPTIGIGDGGNEIGMGNYHDIVKNKLHCAPSVVKADKLVIGTVSNWAGYGLCTYLSRLSGRNLLPTFHEQQRFMYTARELVNCVDGVSCVHTLTEDGYPATVSEEILNALAAEIAG